MLVIRKAEIEAVAVKPAQYPAPDLPEIAFAGRSNVGKSTLLNLLTGRNKLAKVSSSPGKTRTINFYRINDAFRIVDLPGYGYAKVSKSESEKWGKMMEEFLENRESLRTVFQLVDVRHDPTAQDIQMYEYLKYYDLDGPVIMTKADKVSRAQANKNAASIRKKLGVRSETPIIAVSSLKYTGKDEILDAIDKILVQL